MFWMRTSGFIRERKDLSVTSVSRNSDGDTQSSLTSLSTTLQRSLTSVKHVVKVSVILNPLRNMEKFMRKSCTSVKSALRLFQDRVHWKCTFLFTQILSRSFVTCAIKHSVTRAILGHISWFTQKRILGFANSVTECTKTAVNFVDISGWFTAKTSSIQFYLASQKD